ncbi:MAG: histidine kinase [Gammaproteobacteria bacterium HGW-Gammaproteobacteria-3]|nr:MAG: histidine kinase [Gammaproteobacteria bacterium HGW-Gammaproteobacteria-3]
MSSVSPADFTLADLFRGNLQLTSPPAIYFQLKNIIEDPNRPISDAGQIIDKDPALSMRLLKLVNSAFFGFPARITTINHAINLVGAEELQNLVLGTLVIEKFSSLPGGMLTAHEFWAMSLRCALSAKELANYWEKPSDTESLFICGLLHDIGKLVFYNRIPELAREVGLFVESGYAEVDAERHIIGFDHYQAGAYLSRLWNLPGIIGETIAQHASPDYQGPYKKAADIVRTADLINKMEFSLDATCLEPIGISDSLLSQIVDKVHDQFEDIFAVFYPAR